MDTYLYKSELSDNLSNKKRKVIKMDISNLNINNKYKIEIHDLTYSKHILDIISTNQNGYNYVLKKDKLYCKEGTYKIIYESNEIDVEIISISNMEINLIHNNLSVLKSYIKYLDNEINITRKSRNCVNYYVYNNNKWEILNGCQKRSLDTVFLNKTKKKELLDNINNFLLEKNLYIKLGIPYKYNILLYGLPGTGKTSLVSAIASEFNYDIAYLTCKNDDLLNDKQIIIALSKLPKNCILLIEDIELISNDINITSILDGVTINSGLLTFMTSNINNKNNILSNNHKSSNNNPLIRPSRIDFDLNFTWAKKNEIIEMFSKFYSSNKEIFDEFYNKSKGIKLTISLLQHYFFKNRTIESLLLNINNLKELSNNFYPINHSFYG